MSENMTMRQMRFAVLCMRAADPDRPLGASPARVGDQDRGMARALVHDPRVPEPWRPARPVVSYGHPFTMTLLQDGNGRSVQPAVLVVPAGEQTRTAATFEWIAQIVRALERFGIDVLTDPAAAAPPPDPPDHHLIAMARSGSREAWERLPLDLMREADGTNTMPSGLTGTGRRPALPDLGFIRAARGRPRPTETRANRYSPRPDEDWPDLRLVDRPHHDPYVDHQVVANPSAPSWEPA